MTMPWTCCAYDESQAEGKGVAVKNGKFIGPPMVIAAKKVLNRHDLIEARRKKLGH